jgi:hypothetical protein
MAASAKTYVVEDAEKSPNPKAARSAVTFCMPCKSDLSGTVGWSRTQSLSPAQTIRVGRGESAAV